MNFLEVWKEKCEAARNIEDDFGRQNALNYLIGERFLDALLAAESSVEVRAELSDFAAEIVLIDGQTLAQLMTDHDIGVSTARSYVLKRIDSDYFSEDEA
jgi:restriction endonuclease Mrr